MVNKEFSSPPTKEVRGRMKECVLNLNGVGCQSVGKSIMGESIDVYKIGNGRGRVIYFGAHHALESITCNLLFAFIHQLATGSCFSLGKDIGAILSAYTFFIVPYVNPDGIDLCLTGCAASPLSERQIKMSGGDFSTWQANARGVDLNHNYAYGFSEYKNIERERGILPGASLYSGEYPESEPETRTAANLVRTLKPSAIVSLHSQGEEIFYSPKTPSVGRTAARLSQITGYRLSLATGTACYGGLCDYTGSIGIPSFTFEVGRGKNPLPITALLPIYNRISGALATFPTLL